MIKKLLIAVTLGSLVGCKLDVSSEEDVADLNRRVDANAQKIEALNSQLSSVTLELSYLRKKVADSEFSIALLEGKNLKPARLTLTEKSYSIAETSHGVMLISVSDAKPFANGVKVYLDVGNTNSATYSGIQLDVAWGKGTSSKPDWDSLQTKRISLPTKFPAGSWTKVEVVLAPAKIEDVGFLTVSAEVDQIRLRRTN